MIYSSSQTINTSPSVELLYSWFFCTPLLTAQWSIGVSISPVMCRFALAPAMLLAAGTKVPLKWYLPKWTDTRLDWSFPVISLSLPLKVIVSHTFWLGAKFTTEMGMLFSDEIPVQIPAHQKLIAQLLLGLSMQSQQDFVDSFYSLDGWQRSFNVTNAHVYILAGWSKRKMTVLHHLNILCLIHYKITKRLTFRTVQSIRRDIRDQQRCQKKSIVSCCLFYSRTSEKILRL